jgi:uncharacterized protein with PIN domain
MSQPIIIRFHGQLNDFLQAQLKDRAFDVAFKKARSVKDLIESIGIPHTEIDLIICNDKSVAFDYQVQPGDRIEVYPLSVSPVLSQSDHAIIHCQPELLSEHRFVLDVHLGKLASYLRMLGFDTLYRNDYDDPVLADISAAEQRILLTCDRMLLMRKQVSYGYYVRNRRPQQQLLEILSRYELYAQIKPFSRCMHCNGDTRPVSKRSIETRLLAKTKKHYNDFYQCDTCKKIYWKGSHYQEMKKLIDRLKTGDVYK